MKLTGYLSLFGIILLIPICVWAWGVLGLSGGVPSGITSASDNFNRSNEDPLAGNWETIDGTGIDLVSNQVQAGSAEVCVSAWKASVTDFADDQKAELKIYTVGAWDRCGPAVRATSTSGGNYYALATGTSTSNWVMGEMTDGAWSELATGTGITWAEGDTLTIEVVTSGSDAIVTGKRNGVELSESTGTNPATDSSPRSGGQPGIYYEYANVNATKGDDWSASDL